MGCDCSKHPSERKDLEDLATNYAKFAVKDSLKGHKAESQKNESSFLQPATTSLPPQPPSQLPPPPSPPLPSHNVYSHSDPATGNLYTFDWVGLEKDTQRFNYSVMKDDFIKNPELFLVNQLLLTVQFFKNYDRDREVIASRKKESENDLNEKLTSSKKHSVVSNSIFHFIQDNVGFRSLDLPDVLEPLHPTQNFIIHESIETNRKEEFDCLKSGSLQYSQIDEPIYRVCLDPMLKNIGYCRLQCVDDIARRCSEDIILPNSRYEKFELQLPVSDPELSTGEEDELADTISPLSGETFEDFGRMKSSPRLEPRQLQRSASAGSRNVFEPQAPKSEAEKEAKLHNQVRRAQSLNMNLATATTSSTLSAEPQKSSNLKPKAQDQPPQRSPILQQKIIPEVMNALVEDNYGYAVQKEITLKSSSSKFILRSASSLSNDGNKAVLPKYCFQTLQIPVNEADDKDPYQLGVDLEDRTYLVSAGFMKHFGESFYDLVHDLNKGELFNGAICKAPKIMCRQERPITENTDYSKEDMVEFIPAVEVSFWPDEAIEWHHFRKRQKMRDKRTNSFYRWPPDSVMMAVVQCGCNLVPIGFIPPNKESDKKTSTLNFSLEWQIHFTKAEHILMRSLNHPKLRCYLFSLLLYKSFISPMESINEEHIRHMLFKMIEENPADWRDENLGEKLVELLTKLQTALSKEKLPNYFIKKQDLLATLPKHKILKAQEKLFRINEHIVLNVIRALKNIQYSKKGFYPMPDLDELYRILTVTNALKIMNPQLMASAKPQKEGHDKPKPVKPRAKDEYQQKMRDRRDKLMKEKKSSESSSSPTPTDEIPTVTKNEFDLNVKIVTPLDDSKKKLILEFFIKHFIVMAKESNKFRSYGQGLMYVMQAENLLDLYAEIGYSGSPQHSDFQVTIQQLRDVSRGCTREYWQMNWGDDDNTFYSHPTHDTLSRGRYSNPPHENSSDSLRAPQAPLPSVPLASSMQKLPKPGKPVHKVSFGAADQVDARRWRRDQSLTESEVHVEHRVTIEVHPDNQSSESDDDEEITSL